jgi:riboflavin synthase
VFTGIIEEIGKLQRITPTGEGAELSIACDRVLADIKPEDSLAVNGVCLTVVSREGSSLIVQAVAETLSKTGIGKLVAGRQLHLERALLPTTRMGGHFVQGHVDCVGRVRRLDDARPGKVLHLAVPKDYARYTPRTGSVCLDGVSLTLSHEAQVDGSEAVIRVALIPYTLEATLLGGLHADDGVNVEFDCLAKYMEQLLRHHGEPGKGGNLSMDRLRELGY